METVDTVVVGGGVVGLAVTRALARAGHEVLLVESEDAVGTGTSSRNSEVIHAGIYYPAGSHKARLCVAGKRELYRFAEEYGVAHRRCGKLIVATSADQEAALHQIRGRAEANGVHDLRWLSGDEARRLEPELVCTAALESPSTGIIDSHGFMRALLADAKLHGALLALRSPVERCRIHGSGIEVHIAGTAVRARRLVNSAGLFAPQLASRMEGFPPERVPTPRYCKGSYFSLAGPSPFRRLVYPVPEAAGLGVHLTLDLGGQARFGPDVEWVEDIDYDVDERRCAGFYAAIRRYWPNLRDGALHAGYAGIRPKAHAPHEPAADFILDGPADHGVSGLVQLFGIESPGLTASLAIADRVRDMLAV